MKSHNFEGIWYLPFEKFRLKPCYPIQLTIFLPQFIINQKMGKKRVKPLFFWKIVTQSFGPSYFMVFSHSWIKVERPRARAIHPDRNQDEFTNHFCILTPKRFFYCFKTISQTDIWCPFQRRPVSHLRAKLKQKGTDSSTVFSIW